MTGNEEMALMASIAVDMQDKEVNEILNKIRAEIEEYRDSLPWGNNTIVKWNAINYILEQIIDKYRQI